MNIQHTYGWPDTEPVFHGSPQLREEQLIWDERDEYLERMLNGEIEWNQPLLDALEKKALSVKRMVERG